MTLYFSGSRTTKILCIFATLLFQIQLLELKFRPSHGLGGFIKN